MVQVSLFNLRLLKSPKTKRALPLVALLLVVVLIAGCTATSEKPTTPKKLPDSAKFQGYAQVVWAPDGKRIYTIEGYGVGPKSWNSRLYSRKPDLSDKKLLARGVKTFTMYLHSISPKGKYVMFTRVVEEQQGGFRPSPKRDLAIAEAKTGKIVSVIQDASPGGWKNDNNVWYQIYSAGTGVVKTIKVGASTGVDILKGEGIEGLMWSDDGRYFIYKTSTVDVETSVTTGNLSVLDTQTNKSSNLIEPSAGYFAAAVLDRNNLYYAFLKNGSYSLDIEVIDIYKKTNKVLWTYNRPPTAQDPSHGLSVRRLYLDRAKKNLIFYLDERDLQALVYKVFAYGDPWMGAEKVALVQANSGMGDNPFDYCAANNSIVWIEQGKTIKTMKLK